MLGCNTAYIDSGCEPFPTNWWISINLQTAIVKPLLKKTPLDSEDLKNYRPVSNLYVKSAWESCAISNIAKHKLHKLLVISNQHIVHTIALKLSLWKWQMNYSLQWMMARSQCLCLWIYLQHLTLLTLKFYYIVFIMCLDLETLLSWFQSYLENRK